MAINSPPIAQQYISAIFPQTPQNALVTKFSSFHTIWAEESNSRKILSMTFKWSEPKTRCLHLDGFQKRREDQNQTLSCLQTGNSPSFQPQALQTPGPACGAPGGKWRGETAPPCSPSNRNRERKTQASPVQSYSLRRGSCPWGNEKVTSNTIYCENMPTQILALESQPL